MEEMRVQIEAREPTDGEIRVIQEALQRKDVMKHGRNACAD